MRNSNNLLTNKKRRKRYLKHYNSIKLSHKHWFRRMFTVSRLFPCIMALTCISGCHSRWTPCYTVIVSEPCPEWCAATNCFSKNIADVFPSLNYVSMHLKDPGRQTDKITAFAEVCKHALDHFSKCIWLAAKESCIMAHQFLGISVEMV